MRLSCGLLPALGCGGLGGSLGSSLSCVWCELAVVKPTTGLIADTTVLVTASSASHVDAEGAGKAMPCPFSRA